MINTMKHYYLINNTIKKGSEMPIQHLANVYADWYLSLQPCEISESELEKVEMYLTKNMSMYMDFSNPIDVTDIVEEKVTHQLLSMPPINCYELFFKQPKQVDGEIEAVEFAEWILCNYNTSEDGMSLCWHNADTRIKKNKYSTKEIYEIFKNRK